MAARARLKNEFTEDEKCHNLMTWLIFRIIMVCKMGSVIYGEKKQQVYNTFPLSSSWNPGVSVSGGYATVTRILYGSTCQIENQCFIFRRKVPATAIPWPQFGPQMNLIFMAISKVQLEGVKFISSQCALDISVTSRRPSHNLFVVKT